MPRTVKTSTTYKISGEVKLKAVKKSKSKVRYRPPPVVVAPVAAAGPRRRITPVVIGAPSSAPPAPMRSGLADSTYTKRLRNMANIHWPEHDRVTEAQFQAARRRLKK